MTLFVLIIFSYICATKLTLTIFTTMWELLRDILSSPSGSFATVIGIGALLIWIVHFCTKKITKHECTIENSQGQVGKLENNIDAIKSDISYIKGMIGLIQNNAPNSLVRSHSPISLTEKGIAIAEEIGIERMIASNFDEIVKFIEQGTLSRNAYDIQQFLIETATINPEKFFSKENMDIIKQYAFNAGQNLAYYGGMIGVIIRDKYFARKGIDANEVDRHDPSQQK